MTDQTAIAEGSEALTWIVTRLKANAKVTAGVGSRIYFGVAPNDAAYPFITLNVMDTDDVMGVGPWILMSRMVVLVRATVNQASVYPLRTIVAGIHEALHSKSGDTAGARILSSVRIRPHIAPLEEDNGIYFSHAGGEYRLQVRPLTTV